MQNSQRENRNMFLDFLRACAIIIVVFGHALQSCVGNTTNPLHIIIQTFQMSLLFAISGYAVGFSLPLKNVKHFLLGKVKRLLLPYIVWSQLNYILVSCISNNYKIVSQIQNLLTSEFWFLRVLFLMYVVLLVYYLVQKLLSKFPIGKYIKNFFGWGACVCAAFVVSRIPGCRSILNYFPFFVAGIVIYKFRSFFMGKRVYFLISVGITVFFVISTYLLLRADGLLRSLLDKSMAVTGSISLCIVAYLFYKANWGEKGKRFMAFIGQNTLAIYAIHWCIFFSLPLPLYYDMVASMGVYLSSLIVASIWLGLCLLMIVMMKKMRITRTVLLGEK